MNVRHIAKSLLSSIAGIALAGTAMIAGIGLDPSSGRFLAAAEASESVIRIKQTGPGVSKRVKLGLNKAIVIDLPTDAHDILVADPSLADAVTRTSRRLYLFGKTVGQTNIFIFGPSGEEIVAIDLEIERDVSGLQGHLARFLPDSDIKVEIISDNIVLTGSVRTPQDAAQAARLAQIFLTGGEATTRVTTATSEGGDAAINAEARQKSQIVNLLKIDGEDQVMLKVTIAEVSRQVLKQLGFNSSIVGSSAAMVNSNPANLGTLSTGLNYAALAKTIGGASISSYVNAMQQAGVMRTLAEPSLTAISGESARFYVGGEFQIRDEVTTDNNGRVTYTDREVEYGIRLNFTPVVLSAGRISLKVLTEVSEPSFEGSTSIQGTRGSPGMTRLSIKRREAETAVELPSGGSIVLAGLVKDDIRQAMSGYPGLSQVPVFGTLFRSRDFVRNETELVIIATPYIVKPVARNEIARPDDNFNAAGDGAGFFLGRVNRVYGRMETELPPGRYHGVVGFIYK
ncbi:MAG: type II and III secretion system protein family protein [Hoeflea sp.]|nr:type II and III secretion system protein family protein [Alphaproteobacteria bacterium]MBV1724915.1 type II and III secretion system protein family protein [Hoeflea sp.]MBU4544496.1 type II and III secretion system protein family protein [Alphaproteobacteria bacterium]MBU4552727.1 type II and III secretion system protein family protein [Alphaproteobacteria bacterium]MBV1760935.1 type II and III secretion system protein family protein [Hoeflea sp.]